MASIVMLRVYSLSDWAAPVASIALIEPLFCHLRLPKLEAQRQHRHANTMPCAKPKMYSLMSYQRCTLGTPTW